LAEPVAGPALAADFAPGAAAAVADFAPLEVFPAAAAADGV
jgi:hypothetical protein